MADADNIISTLLMYFNSVFNLNLKLGNERYENILTTEIAKSNNMDLRLRHIEALKQYSEEQFISDNSYYKKHTDPNKPGNFIDLYKSIKNNGYDKSKYLTVLDIDEIFNVIDIGKCKDHPDRVIRTFYEDFPFKYYRIDGSHRVSIALLLKIESLPCKVYEVKK